MSGTMVSDQGFLVEKKTHRLLAHAALNRGDVVAVDFAVTDAVSLLPTTTMAATHGGSDMIVVVALQDLASGERGWFASKGLIDVNTQAVADGASLSVDAGTADSLDDDGAASGEVIKVVGKSISGYSAGVNLIIFNGEEGFGTQETVT